MIKIITNCFIILLLCSFQSIGQISVVKADFPQLNEIYSRCNAAIQSVEIDSTGANYDWDYSNLTLQSTDSDTVVTSLSTPLAYNIAFTNFLDQTHFASFAIRANQGQTVMSFLNISDVYEFFKSNNNGYEMVGFGAKFNGIPLPTTYTPVERMYDFPVDYLDDDSSDYAFGLSIPGIGYYGQETTRSYEVDGWGQLQLPDTTYDVLRVRINKWITDTIYSDSLGFGFRIPRPKETQLVWLAKNEGLPILHITGTDGFAGFLPNSIRYKCINEPLPNSVIEIPKHDNYRVYGSQNTVNIERVNGMNLELDQIEVYNGIGQLLELNLFDIYSGNQLQVDFSEHVAGLYYFKLKSNANLETIKYFHSN
jgi:hypothetical protein